MNKTELIERISTSADLSKVAAAEILETVLQTITTTLKKGEQVVLVGFGTFSIRDRQSRTVRVPGSDKLIQTKPSKVPVFKAGKLLKEAVQAEGAVVAKKTEKIEE